MHIYTVQCTVYSVQCTVVFSKHTRMGYRDMEGWKGGGANSLNILAENLQFDILRLKLEAAWKIENQLA
jgi:hypothetical protein